MNQTDDIRYISFVSSCPANKVALIIAFICDKTDNLGIDRPFHPHTRLLNQQEALLTLQRGRTMLRVCIASIQNVERSLLLLVVSASIAYN